MLTVENGDSGSVERIDLLQKLLLPVIFSLFADFLNFLLLYSKRIDYVKSLIRVDHQLEAEMVRKKFALKNKKNI